MIENDTLVEFYVYTGVSCSKFKNTLYFGNTMGVKARVSMTDTVIEIRDVFNKDKLVFAYRSNSILPHCVKIRMDRNRNVTIESGVSFKGLLKPRVYKSVGCN